MSSKKIVLISSDGESFEVEEAVARELQIVAHMIDDDCADKPIPLHNVTGKDLSMVTEYCKKHVEASVEVEGEDEDEDEDAKKAKLESWDAGFLKDQDLDTVFRLILAANYLNVKGLLDLACQYVADHIKNKSVEEVREIFNIVSDLTPEEEAALRKEHEWAFNDH